MFTCVSATVLAAFSVISSLYNIASRAYLCGVTLLDDPGRNLEIIILWVVVSLTIMTCM